MKLAGKISLSLAVWMTLGSATNAWAADARKNLQEAQKLYNSGQYFSSARYAYAAGQESGVSAGESNSWVALSLMKAGLYNSATYFFIKTLESRDRNAIKRVLTQTENILSRIGPDLLREYLVKYTQYEDYDAVNRSAYLFALGKAAILRADENRAIEYLNQVKSESRLFPYSLQLRATALTIQGRVDEALDDFNDCEKYSDLIITENDMDSPRYIAQRNEAKDLNARCIAGQARVLYQAEKFEDADRMYDRIPKQSFVWPDILFEQAWNGFAKREFNRTLGKLVSYKSPALQFVFNSEIEVLRAQSYLSLCLYDDTQKAIDDFSSRYNKMGVEVKRFVEGNHSNLDSFYQLGAQTLKSPLSTTNSVAQLVNRFVRGPYFPALVAQDASLEKERGAIASFAKMTGADHRGLVSFLSEVLKWRRKTIRQLGGAFIKNSLIDHHTVLVADYEKISFIKLEMLSRAKDKLIRKANSTLAEQDERTKGNIKPLRKDNQYFWSFNGEFWNDELGDYVFGLESECAK
jgi:hypothetical protein